MPGRQIFLELSKTNSDAAIRGAGAEPPASLQSVLEERASEAGGLYYNLLSLRPNMYNAVHGNLEVILTSY